jgi:hypothetical protein
MLKKLLSRLKFLRKVNFSNKFIIAFSFFEFYLLFYVLKIDETFTKECNHDKVETNVDL